MKQAAIRFLIIFTAVLITAHLPLLEIHYTSFGALFLAVLLLSVANVIVKPLLILFTLPAVLLSLGLFVTVINALLLWGVSTLVDGFHVGGFWSAFFGGLAISLISLFLGPVTKKSH